MWAQRRVALLTVAVCLSITSLPNAVADEPGESLLPPENVYGTYNAENDTVILHWTASPDANTTYRVYRNAVLVGDTNDTGLEVNLTDSINAFQVTTWYDGNESIPSTPTVVQAIDDGNGGTIWTVAGSDQVIISWTCPMASAFTDINHAPYVFVVIREECIPIIGKTLEVPGDGIQIGWG